MIGFSTRVAGRSTRFGVRNAAEILCALLFLLSSAEAQTSTSFYGQIVDQTGKPAPFSLLRVCASTGGGSPCNPLVDIYSDPGMTHQISNPFTTDSRGNYTVFVAAGYYILQFSVAGSGMYSYIASAPSSGTGGATFPSTPAVVVNTSTTTSRNGTFADIVGLFNCPSGGFLQSTGNCGNAASVPAPATSVPFVNSGVTAFQTDPTFIFNATNKSLQANTFFANVVNPVLNGSINATEIYNNTIPNLDGFFHNLVKSGTGWNYGPSANVTNSFSTFGLFFSQFTITVPGITQFLSGTMEKRSPGDTAFIYCSGCYTSGGENGNSDEGYTAFHVNGGEAPDTYSSTISAGTTQGATFINAPAQISTGGGLYTMNLSQRLEVGCITGAATLVNHEFWLETVGCGGAVTPSTAAGDLACPGGLQQLADQSVPQSITCTVNQSPSTSISPNFHTGVASLAGGFNEQVLITAVGSAGSTQTITFTYRKPNLTSWAPNGTFGFFVGQVWDGTNVERVFSPQGNCTTGTAAPSWNPTQGGFTTDGTCTWQNNGSQINTATTLWQGGSVQGNLQAFDKDLLADSMSMSGTCYGATDTTHIVCGQTIEGEQVAPDYSTIPTLQIINLSKSGTTVTATTTGSGLIYSGVASAVISGCSDSALNGTVTNVIGGSSSITWTQSGGGTGCDTANIDLDPAYHNQSFFPMAEQTSGQVIDASGHNLPGINLEPNIVTFPTGALVQQQHPANFGGAVWWIEHNMSNPYASGTGIKMDFGGAGAANINPIVMENLAPCAQFLGCGGTHTPQPWMQFAGGDGGIINARHSMTANPDFNIFSPLQGINCATPPTQSFLALNADVSQYGGSMNFLPCSQTWQFSGSMSTQNTNQANIFIAGTGANPEAGISANDLGIDAPTSHTIFVGDGTFSSSNGAISTQEVFSPVVTVGATAPAFGIIFHDGTPGSTTYTYEMACNTINGYGPLTAPIITTNGNAVLDGTNNNIVKAVPGGGCVSIDVFRTVAVGSYGVGRICTAVSPAIIGSSIPGCLDTGQSTTGGIPTSDTSGVLKVSGPITGTSFTGTSISSGTASNTDLAGRLTLAGGTISRTFSGTYTTAPVCVANDNTALQPVQVTTTTTALAISGTGTDVVSYICVGLN